MPMPAAPLKSYLITELLIYAQLALANDHIVVVVSSWLPSFVESLVSSRLEQLRSWKAAGGTVFQPLGKKAHSETRVFPPGAF